MRESRRKPETMLADVVEPEVPLGTEEEAPTPSKGASRADGASSGEATPSQGTATREEASPPDETAPAERRRGRHWRRAILTAALLPVAFYGLCVLGLIYVRFLPPVITGVQLQRTVERVIAGEDPVRDYRWRPMEQISSHFPRAVVAAEDARFFQHAGFDWREVQRAVDEADRTGEPMRGASTLTQQLIKNLFFTTHRNPLRKLYEWALTPPAEWILGKNRILELYVNVVELGPGIFGAEAAARHHYDVPAARLSRHQSASLAAILPAPLRRNPRRMTWYTSVIEGRMARMGW